MNTDMKRLVIASLLTAIAPWLLADVTLTSLSGQTQSLTITVPYCSDVDVHGTAYGPDTSYISGNSPLGSFYRTPSQGSLHLTGKIPAGTYTLYEDVGASGYLCYMIMVHLPETLVMSSTTAVSSPTDTHRTKIGVGEVVTVTLMPAPFSTTWDTIPSGSGSLTNPLPGQVTFTAPATASNVTVRATSGDGYQYTRTFEVVAPSGVYMERNVGLGIFHIKGTPSAGMKTDVYILPNDVNFSAVEFREERCTPSIADGYFLPLINDTHNQGSWVPLSNHTPSKGTLASVPDKISTWGEYEWSHQPGSFQWQIPWTYRLKIGGGNGYPIGTGAYTASHNATAYASGAITVSKASAIYTASLDDPNGIWTP